MQLISHSDEILINPLHILTLNAPHDRRALPFIPFHCSVFGFVFPLSSCSSYSPSLVFRTFFFVFSSSKDAPLALPHHSLNLSIFCHGEKHLNLSLHLFITCHLRFPLLLPSLSPPLHLCVFPAAPLLLFMPFASSVSIALFFPNRTQTFFDR